MMTGERMCAWVRGCVGRPDGRWLRMLLVWGLLVPALAITTVGQPVGATPPVGAWRSLPDMSLPRLDHTATLLPNGKVLVAGGTPTGTYCSPCGTDSAVLYDPATGAWSPTGSMVRKRDFQSAALLPTGKVLVVGGIVNDPGNDFLATELYDPGTGTWTAASPVPRSTPDALFTLRTNKVLAVYSDGPSALYDPVSGTWQSTGTMRHLRGTTGATLLQDGRLLWAGGARYDVATGGEILL